MKHNIRNAVCIIAVASLTSIACQKEIRNTGQSTLEKPHSISVYLTDHQTPVFDSVFIDIQKLEVKLEDDSLPSGGWVALHVRAGVYNILKFRNGLDTLFGTGTLPNGRIRKIKLTLGIQNSVMKDGQTFPLEVKQNDHEIIANIESENFEITAQGTILFWIDFDAGRSIQMDNSGSGNNNGYRLKSHIKIFTHSRSGRIEGKVLPAAADPVVQVISGVDTATAIPDFDDGEFKVVGLNAGTYSIFIDGNNNYNDTLITNVIVKINEDTHIPTITLHQ